MLEKFVEKKKQGCEGTGCRLKKNQKVTGRSNDLSGPFLLPSDMMETEQR